jgi:FG-GAP repeat
VAHAPVPNDWHIQGTGDFDGDGNSDILWRHDSGQVYIWEMNGFGITAEGGVAHAPVPGDWHIFSPNNFV